MKIKTFISFLLILISYIYPYRYEKKIEKSFTLGKEDVVIVNNVNGLIRLSINQKKEVFVKAIKLSEKKDDFNNVEIEFKYQQNQLNIYTKRNKKKCKVIVNLYVSIPKNTKYINLNSTNGRIEVIGNYQNLKSKSINGETEFEGTFINGNFNAVNGSINLYIKDVLKGNINAATENGSLKIELNEESSFTIDGSSLNGYIKSDFNLPVIKGFVTSKIKGSVNQGKYKIIIKTTNGSIKLLKI